MLESAEWLIEDCKDKSYRELLFIREELLEKIYAFENKTYDPKYDMFKPSPQVTYERDLEYLGMLCNLISEKHNLYQQSHDANYVDIIRMDLDYEEIDYKTSLTDRIRERVNLEKYTIENHIRGLIYSIISNQKKWYVVDSRFKEIDDLFYEYDHKKILTTDPGYFISGIYALRCGNENTIVQMKSLADNIRTLQKIEKDYGSIDEFIASESAEKIVKKLSKHTSRYKLKSLSKPLVWDYLINVGIDLKNPDIYLRRFFGADRMGTGKNSPATKREVVEQIDFLSEHSGMSRTKINMLIWCFCANGYGDICTEEPNCDKCIFSNKISGRLCRKWREASD